MTIKLPVAADLLETDARPAWRIVDADGVVIPWGTVVAALNATGQIAPDAETVANAILDALEGAGFALWSAYTDWDGQETQRRPRPTRRPAPVTAETPMRLWTPTASGGYRLAYVEDGQPVGLMSDPDTDWTLVPAAPDDIYVHPAGARQYQG